ncbi:MAG TPA: isochorismatase family protein [Gemmatimonadales bacterium]|nr:isochorismatase family protein [Gemmatimonadales bacterium]
MIDVQESFRADAARWARRGNPAFEANLVRLVSAYRAAGLPLIFFLHTDPDPFFERESPYLRLMDFMVPRAEEPVLLKDTRNCFTSTDLEQRLRALGVGRLVITGVQTEQCCETTARLAADLGYDVDFVTEATQTFPIRHTDPGVDDELPVADVVRRTEFALRGRFARIATVDALGRELEGVMAPSAG